MSHTIIWGENASSLTHLYVSCVIVCVLDVWEPVARRLGEVFRLCDKPQQLWPAWGTQKSQLFLSFCRLRQDKTPLWQSSLPKFLCHHLLNIASFKCQHSMGNKIFHNCFLNTALLASSGNPWRNGWAAEAVIDPNGLWPLSWQRLLSLPLSYSTESYECFSSTPVLSLLVWSRLWAQRISAALVLLGSPEDQAVTHSGASTSPQLRLLLWKVLHHRPHPHPPKLNKSNDCNCSKWPTLSTASKGRLTFKLWYLSCGAFGQSFMACIASQGHSHSTASKQKAYLLTSCILRNVKIKAIHRVD